MKKLIALFFFLMTQPLFADLYLTTQYQEGDRPKVTTKQHIFLNKRYIVNYTKMRYVLILKKISGDEATIETESYNIDKRDRKTLAGGSVGTYKVGKSFLLKDHTPDGATPFHLAIYLERIVPTKP